MGTPEEGLKSVSEPNGVNIYNNIIPDDKAAIKLGIKAPPGTQVEINDSIFMVGASGTFTVNKPGYEIKTLRFIKPVIITKNEGQSEEKMKEAIDKMGVAVSNLLTNSKATIAIVDGAQGESKAEFDETYTILNPSINYAIYSTFLKEFTDAYYKYGEGYRGIYNVDNISGDLQNILIDLEIKE